MITNVMGRTVTAAEIARLAGVGRAAVSQWRRRYPDFPREVGGTATRPRFDLAEVEEWLRRQGRLEPRSVEDRLWWTLAVAGDDPVATLGLLGEALLRDQNGSRARARAIPDGTDPRRLARLVRDARAVAADLGAAQTFDLLRQRLMADPAGRGRDVPDDLADLMAALAGVRGGSVFDPACGLGGLLRGAVRAGCAAAYGQDLDADAARLARVWLGLQETPGEVAVGDSLRADAFAGTLVDAVVCAPPFGQTGWGQEELAYDPRWVFGVPPRTEPELAWVQHALAHLRPGGRAVVLMPPAAAGRRAGRRIRGELLRRGALRAVVALPAGAAAAHAVPLHLWVLRQPVPGQPTPTHVLLVDASTLTGPDRPRSWLRDFPVASICAWLDTNDARRVPDEAGRAVAIIDLLDDDVDVSPVRRAPDHGSADSAGRLADARRELVELLADLSALVPDFAVDEGGNGAPVTTVAELARAGDVEILGPTRPGRDETPDRPVSTAPPVMTVKNVLNGTPPAHAELPALPVVEVREGDVVIPVTARRLVARVVGPDEVAVLGPNLVALRPVEGVLDPWFLAGQLSTSANGHRQASSLAGVVRFDPRRAQVARLPFEQQRTYGWAFRQLALFGVALRRVGALGDDLIRVATDALAAGAIRFDDRTETRSVRLPSARRFRS